MMVLVVAGAPQAWCSPSKAIPLNLVSPTVTQEGQEECPSWCSPPCRPRRSCWQCGATSRGSAHCGGFIPLGHAASGRVDVSQVACAKGNNPDQPSAARRHQPSDTVGGTQRQAARCSLRTWCPRSEPPSRCPPWGASRWIESSPSDCDHPVVPLRLPTVDRVDDAVIVGVGLVRHPRSTSATTCSSRRRYWPQAAATKRSW